MSRVQKKRELRFQFAEPLRLLDMERSTAKYLGRLLIEAATSERADDAPQALLALEARHGMRRVVARLEPINRADGDGHRNGGER